MKTGIGGALQLTLCMSAAIFFCRLFPFLFFRNRNSTGPSLQKTQKEKAFLDFVEKTVPPVAMTVLAFNSIAFTFKESPSGGMAAVAAAVFTALLHLWRRNPLISIFGGTAAYLALQRLLIR